MNGSTIMPPAEGWAAAPVPLAQTRMRILPMGAALPRLKAARVPNGEQLKVFAANACYLALRLTGWLAVTGLATLGLFVVFFLLLGDMGADGFFAQLANLANRYGAAEPARQASFLDLVGTVAAILFAGVAAARWRSLAALLSPSSYAKDRP